MVFTLDIGASVSAVMSWKRNVSLGAFPYVALISFDSIETLNLSPLATDSLVRMTT